MCRRFRRVDRILAAEGGGGVTFCRSGDGSCGGSVVVIENSRAGVWRQQWLHNVLLLDALALYIFLSKRYS